MTNYFPTIAAHSPAIQAWMQLYPDLFQLPFIPPSNASRRERALRVLETETFCAATGVLTLLDPRPSRSPAVFGCPDYPSVLVSYYESPSCEAVKLPDCAGEPCETASGLCAAPSNDGMLFSFQNRLCEAVKL